MRRHHPLLLLAVPVIAVICFVCLASAAVHHAAQFDLEMQGNSVSLCHTISDMPSRCQPLF